MVEKHCYLSKNEKYVDHNNNLWYWCWKNIKFWCDSEMWDSEACIIVENHTIEQKKTTWIENVCDINQLPVKKKKKITNWKLKQITSCFFCFFNTATVGV